MSPTGCLEAGGCELLVSRCCAMWPATDWLPQSGFLLLQSNNPVLQLRRRPIAWCSHVGPVHHKQPMCSRLQSWACCNRFQSPVMYACSHTRLLMDQDCHLASPVPVSRSQGGLPACLPCSRSAAGMPLAHPGSHVRAAGLLQSQHTGCVAGLQDLSHSLQGLRCCSAVLLSESREVHELQR